MLADPTADREEMRQLVRSILRIREVMGLFFDPQVLEEARRTLGPNVQHLVVGGAAVPPVVLSFMRECFNWCVVTNGYGSTECGSISHDNVRLIHS